VLGEAGAHDAVRDLILTAFAEYEAAASQS